ncbi:MAG: hypothetical protein MR639_09865 [Clostridium sp.]|uniref:hypothetical protein n=1 Tax=Clostridium sp. TaxID=1506 RepID=UPI002A8E6366|nr:hypothetical protein [Clostridium sp.]MDY5098260.1 hypothetical protein [Clostridium sp.]
MKKKGMSLVEPLITIAVFLMLLYCIYSLFNFNLMWNKKKDEKMTEIFWLEAVKNELLYNSSKSELNLESGKVIYINEIHMDIRDIEQEENITKLFSHTKQGEEYLEMTIENYEIEKYLKINYKMKGKEIEKEGQWIKEI